jgi:crotonobetaine/carnitine-CoA ligase
VRAPFADLPVIHAGGARPPSGSGGPGDRPWRRLATSGDLSKGCREVTHDDIGSLKEGTLGEILRRQGMTRHDTAFVMSDEVTWSFAEVDRLADRCAAWLTHLGVGRGDTVALFMENSAFQVPLTFGINRLGAIWVPTNTDYRDEWLGQSLADSRASVLVVSAGLTEHLKPLWEGLHFEHVIVHGECDDMAVDSRVSRLSELLGQVPPRDADGKVRELEVQAKAGDTAAVLWTSGTTGRAKGVMQSHRAWIRAALSGAASSRTTEDDRLYCCLPLYNSAAWVGVIYRALVAGVPFALDERFSVGSFWDRTRHFGCTQGFTLGAMHMFLWQAPERPDDADNPVRSLGAIPMPDAILEPFKARFGIEIIQQGFGQSEIMGLISRADDGSTVWHPDAVGRPQPGIQVCLLDEEDRPVPTGEVGEICVRPEEPHVLFNGYFQDPEATLAACRNLWYHTGDLGRVDDDGQYFFVDRKDDLIRFKGRSVSSLSVEAALRPHPAVAEVAAFGVDSEVLSAEAEIMAMVVPRLGASVTEEELARFVNDHAPYFIVPRYIELTEGLPHTPTGKVRKHLLRRRGVGPTTWDRQQSGFELKR